MPSLSDSVFVTRASVGNTYEIAVSEVVVEVEYSKAPEHKFPASYDDAVGGP